MRLARRNHWLLLATISTVVLAGCASGTKQDSAGSTTGPASAPSAASGDCSSPQTLKLNVAIGPFLANVGVGQTEGIFARHCLVVEMDVATSPPAALAAVVGASADLTALPTVTIVNTLEKGLPLRAVAPLTKLPDDAASLPGEKFDNGGVYPAAGSGIESAKDLVGKNVSIPGRGTLLEITIAAAVKADGGDPTKINWVALDQPTALQQLAAKSIDAAALTIPFTTQAEAAGFRRAVAPTIALIPPGSTYVMWVTSADTLAKKREAIANFHDAMVEINEFSLENTAVWNKALSDGTKIPLDLIEKGPNLYLSTKMEQADLDVVAERMLDLGFIAKKPDMGNVIVAFD